MTDITELARGRLKLATLTHEQQAEGGACSMTTDITELARRLNICAKEGTYPVLSPADCGALVEALERAQQYAKERDAENQDLMLTVGRLRVEREELESRTVTVKLSKDHVDDADLFGWGVIVVPL